MGDHGATHGTSDRRGSWPTHVFTVHTVKPDDVGAVEVVYLDEQLARAYAVSRSTDFRVLAVSVTEFTVGQLGTRSPVAFYRDGVLQDERAQRPGSLYPVEPWSPATSEQTGRA